MTTQNNAAQSVLTDEEIQDIADLFDIYGEKPEFARAVESTLLSKLRAPVPDGKRPDLDWIEGVRVTDTVGRGWCVRIDGTDIYEDANRYGCKGRKSFQIASGLSNKQEAERAALEWLDRQRAALASAPVADERALHIKALQDLRLGVEMDQHCMEDGDAKLAALDAAITALRWSAGALQALNIEADKITLDGETRTVGDILDHADRALANAPVAGEAQPVGWFQNDAGKGEPPHYSQVSDEYAGELDVYPFYAAAQASAEARDAAAVRDTGKDRLSFHIWALVHGMDITPNDSCGYVSPLTQRAWMRWNPPAPAALAAQPGAIRNPLIAEPSGNPGELERAGDAPREDDMLTIAYLARAQAEKERAALAARKEGDALSATQTEQGEQDA
ncbi:hypothetical protein [Bordetella bronchiseptica]|uniref:Uncharacterized protein n=1 Tax=Bordetella bronchiseptica (strain ATCC BAA-588 / NCTC 13252 / RB50) TaxID=257310 RepID=A0A0H3LUN2_BORBR|nr:hypothetical protein [Bordetella bronchiseptica]KDB91051.1 hypothetical protein AZ17_2250 [Bordetella bronchiseptica D989]KDB99319.1 hypothetical protein AZ23_2331 [Bordetella bronchiseptica E010]KDC90889.1 hypothetical protein L517_2192 [Bordetella bronchiseptica MBORD670]KDD12692.1 hypothetical protein L523_2159 [Bordetella bronchiseptica MBORD731]KDD37406.1 hypothetical protein L528_2192 [Bordetella bronchiseptica MBORD849]